MCTSHLYNTHLKYSKQSIDIVSSLLAPQKGRAIVLYTVCTVYSYVGCFSFSFSKKYLELLFTDHKIMNRVREEPRNVR